MMPNIGAEVDKVFARPLSMFYSIGMPPSSFGDGEEQAECMLRYDRSGAAGDVADDNAQLPSNSQVDRVSADAADGDHAQPRQLMEHVARPGDRAAGVHQTDRVTRSANFFRIIGRTIRIQDDFPVCPQPFQVW
jgi:hypothetical protein